MFKLDYWHNSVSGAFKPSGAKGICNYYKPDLDRIRKEVEDKDSKKLRSGEEEIFRFDLGDVVFRDDGYTSGDEERFPPMSLRTSGSKKDLNDLAYGLDLSFDPKQVVEGRMGELGVKYLGD